MLDTAYRQTRRRICELTSELSDDQLRVPVPATPDGQFMSCSRTSSAVPPTSPPPEWTPQEAINGRISTCRNGGTVRSRHS
jgi:hypothetical protein